MRQDESADLNTHAGVLSSPSYEDIKDALELMEKDLMSAADMAAGAALMIGMSLISGLGTDELLRLQEARGRGGRRRPAARRLRPGEVTGGRDTATTVEDGSRLSLHLSVSSKQVPDLSLPHVHPCAGTRWAQSSPLHYASNAPQL